MDAPRPASLVSPRTSRRGFFGLAARAGALGAVASVGGLASASGSSVAGAEPAPAGTEIGYAETTAPLTTLSVAAVPNLALVVEAQDRPIAIQYGGYVSSSAANGLVKLVLHQDGRPVHEVGTSVAGKTSVGHLNGFKRLTPSSRTSTFVVALVSGTAGAQGVLLAYPASPGFLEIRAL